MTIFGDTILQLNTSSVPLIHNKTLQDSFMNYGAGIFLIFVIPIGVICNILVYIKNHIHSGTVASVMYRCLALSDLLVNLVRSPQQMWALLNPTQQPFYGFTKPTVLRQIIAVVTLVSGLMMMTVISLLGVVRLFSITFPLRFRTHEDTIMRFTSLYIAAVFTMSSGISIYYIVHEKVYWISVTQWIVPLGSDGPDLQVVINLVIPILCLVVAVLSSILTLVYLFCKKDPDSNKKRGSITVLYMNLGVMLWLGLLFGTAKHLPIAYDDMPMYLRNNKYEVYYLYYFVTCYMPLLLATYNSLVVVTRSTEIKKLILKLRRRFRYGHAQNVFQEAQHISNSSNTSILGHT